MDPYSSYNRKEGMEIETSVCTKIEAAWDILLLKDSLYNNNLALFSQCYFFGWVIQQYRLGTKIEA
jgi:hypothetical protein